MSFFVSASLFPSNVAPYTGLFVAHRLRALKEYLNLSQDNVYIASPTPYFPFKHKIFGAYGLYAQKTDGPYEVMGLKAFYPRYFQIPFTQCRFSGWMCYRTLRQHLLFYIAQYGKPSILIAEYGFPDGVAIERLSQEFGINYVVTLRGSDISYFLKLPALTSQIIASLKGAKSIICVSHDMKKNLESEYNLLNNNIHIVGNGVDQDIFRLLPKSDTEFLPHIKTSNLIISVGGLIARKNHALAINSMVHLPDYSLVIAGEGAEYHKLDQLITDLNLKDRVFLVGAMAQEKLAHLYNRADIFLLCSRSEGRANVILEALACGTPVITTDVSGARELVTHSDCGQIVPVNISSKRLSDAILTLKGNVSTPSQIISYVQHHSWGHSAKLYADILKR